MKLSKVDEYREYMFSLVNKEYAKAENALNYCIQLARKDDDNEMLGYLIQKMGDIYYLRGTTDKAVKLYHEAEKVSGGAAMLKYFFAKFMADSLHEYRQSINKCQEVIDLVSSHEWANAEDEPDKNYYLAQCYALQGYLYALVEDYQRALLSLGKLLTIETTYTLNYDLELCELLKAKGYYSHTKPYLQNLLEKVKSSVDHKEYAGFINKVEQLLRPSTDY